MKIALAQINPILGNFDWNLKLVQNRCKEAKKLGADIVLFPELCLYGYPPLDLLERPRTVEDQLKAFHKLEQDIPDDLLVIVGVITHNPRQGKPFLNSAAVLHKGKKSKFFHKSLLPAYDVFDEARHFHFGSVKNNIFKFRGQRILLTICEDIWAWKKEERLHHVNPLKEIPAGDIDLILNLSASPFSVGKEDLRLDMAQRTSRHFKAPMVYVNAVGGQDEIIFDGGSFVLNPKGEKIFSLPPFEESLKVWDQSFKGESVLKKEATELQLLRRSLVLGIRDFCRKNNISKVHLGLSGGVDSALVACLAVEALGAENVHTLALPGPHSAKVSLKLAKELSTYLGCSFETMDFNDAYTETLGTLEKNWGNLDFGVVHENLQARLRGLLLMAYSNKENSVLLNTSNKAEFACGYSTLYGDMCGGLSPIGDLLKHQVYDLVKDYSGGKVDCLEEIIKREPSAELRPGQRDKDSLPPYPQLDQAVQNLVEDRQPVQSKTEKWLEPLLMKTEFKRWQAPPILRVSDHAFGRGRRWPLSFQLKRF